VTADGVPVIDLRALTADSAFQTQDLEVIDERDAIIAVEAAGRYPSRVG
jgi:hypothetical protein